MKITRNQLRRLINEELTKEQEAAGKAAAEAASSGQWKPGGGIEGLLPYLYHFIEAGNLDRDGLAMVNEWIRGAKAHIGWEK